MKRFLFDNKIGILIASVFFIVGIFTLSDYGINIDEPIHFERGNAYLDFFLTGRKKYTSADFINPRTSEWKYIGYDAAYFLRTDSGHPPLNGILAAVTNRIFHEKLGIVGDLESYHLFELSVSTMLIFLIYIMMRKKYGEFPAVIAALSMTLYPLFYGESRFNIKDPIEATFFSFTIYFFYVGVEKVRSKYFLLSSIFCALAFGTKFNIIFFPVIILPYFFVRRGLPFIFQPGKLAALKKIPKSVYISLALFPIIVFGVHFLSRPFLWQDPFNRFMQIVQYYKDTGTGMNYQSRFLIYGWNTYPALFVAASTPLVILVLFLVGVAVAISKVRGEKDKFSFLLLIWFGITLLRVSFPGTSIYGGVRQIMEYIPAMAAIAGIGALFLHQFLSKFLNKKFVYALILVGFFPLVVTLIKMHPNENLFMNSLVGGLNGATQKKIPGVGETMGNAYLQGIWWLNEHAEKNAHFGFPVGLGSNFPPQFVRKDIKFGGVFSGPKRDGEYMMEMFSVEYPFSRYTYDYLDIFLNPVYVKTVDGAPILKIWKNDMKHTKEGFINEVEEKNVRFILDKKNNAINIFLEKPVYVTRLKIFHDSNNCIEESSGSISYSPDGEKDLLAPDDLYRAQGKYAFSLQTKTNFVYMFAGYPIKRLQVTPSDAESCLLKIKSVSITKLADRQP